jgi:hypothetical protein
MLKPFVRNHKNPEKIKFSWNSIIKNLTRPFFCCFFKIANQNCETEQDTQLRKKIEMSISGHTFTNNRCRDDVLKELLKELNEIKDDLLSMLKRTAQIIEKIK